MNQFKTVLALISGIWLLAPNAATAQASRPIPLAQPKAANLARMRAESLNGGLGQYRAASCMYETGAGSCLESISDKGFQFCFKVVLRVGNSKPLPTQPSRHRCLSPETVTESWRFLTTERSVKCKIQLTDQATVIPM